MRGRSQITGRDVLIEVFQASEWKIPSDPIKWLIIPQGTQWGLRGGPQQRIAEGSWSQLEFVRHFTRCQLRVISSRPYNSPTRGALLLAVYPRKSRVRGWSDSPGRRADLGFETRCASSKPLLPIPSWKWTPHSLFIIVVHLFLLLIFF